MKKELVPSYEGELPQGWSIATIGDLISPDGVFIDGDWVESKDQDPNGDVRLIQLADVADGFYKDKSARFLTKKKALELNCTFLKKGDVLIARMPDPLGRACIFPGDAKESVTVVDVCVVRTGSEDINHKWLMYWVNSPRFRNTISSLQSGTTRRRISRGNLATITFPFPPPEQQKRIVAKIEELFSHLDAGIEALKKAKQLLKQYRQSVLKAAVTGELTKEWREANKDKLEPASQLLERILKERRQKWEEQQLGQFKAKGKMPKNDKWKEKYKKPFAPEFEHVSDVPDIPDAWEWVAVSQLTTFVKDGPHYSPKYAEEGIPFITGGNVRPHGVDFDNCKYITDELHHELSNRCKPELNDILYTKGGTTGIARVNTYDFEFNVWVHVAVLRLVNTGLIEPFYMQHSLNSQLCYTQSQKYTHGVGNQDLGLTRMIKICLALPPLEEQREVIEIIDSKMESITRIEEQVDTMLMMGEKNKQSILASAFQGQV